MHVQGRYILFMQYYVVVMYVCSIIQIVEKTQYKCLKDKYLGFTSKCNWKYRSQEQKQSFKITIPI